MHKQAAAYHLNRRRHNTLSFSQLLGEMSTAFQKRTVLPTANSFPLTRYTTRPKRIPAALCYAPLGGVAPPLQSTAPKS